MMWKTTCSLAFAGMLVAGLAFAQTGSPPPGGSPSSPPQQGTPEAPAPDQGQSEKSDQSKTHRKHGARGKLQPCAPGTTSTPEAPCRPAGGTGKPSSSQSQPGGAMK